MSHSKDISKNSSKTVLVPGGAGFIGATLVRKLLELNYKVVVWDNLYTGRKSNIADLASAYPDQFQFEEVDIRFEKEFHCHYIINLACPASPVHYQKDPVYTWETSVLGMLNLLKIARKNNAIVVHASTSEVYGDPLEHPQKESYWGNVNPVGIRSCYDEGKRAAETICVDYYRMYGVQTRMVRIFNTYGPYMLADDGRVVSNFIVQALRKQPLTVYGDGSQTRSFCYVSDLVDGFIAMMERPDPIETPVNFGNPGEFTISELAGLIEQKLGEKLDIEYKPLPQDDPARRRPDITRATELFGWRPKVFLEDGLEPTIEYFRKEIEG